MGRHLWIGKHTTLPREREVNGCDNYRIHPKAPGTPEDPTNSLPSTQGKQRTPGFCQRICPGVGPLSPSPETLLSPFLGFRLSSPWTTIQPSLQRTPSLLQLFECEISARDSSV